MLKQSQKCTLISSVFLCFLSFCAWAINHFFFQFHGNNYFPAGAFQAGITLLAIFLSIQCYLSKTHYLYQVSKALLFFYAMMVCIALITNGIQFTPFPPIDPLIIAIENRVGMDMALIVQWTHQYPALQRTIALIYDSLPYQMGFLPVIVALLGQFSRLYHYFCWMLVSAILGFSCYYFFPTTAPASNVISPYFSIEQLATGLKFREIHQHLYPSTIEGGMIAFPSFHAVWAWLCVYLVADIPLLWWFLFPVNVLLTLSCVFLGWHYPIDILGSVVLMGFSYCVIRIRPTSFRTPTHVISNGSEKSPNYGTV